MILPRVITGFNVPGTVTPPDERIFASDCWAAVASRRGRVEDRPQVLPASPTTFITRVLVLPGGEVTVLLKTIHPWVGFCRPLRPGDCGLDFLDPGPVAKALATTGRYRVLEVRELVRPITGEMCGELGRAELRQLKYWSELAGRGKLRVGDAVFNFWD